MWHCTFYLGEGVGIDVLFSSHVQTPGEAKREAIHRIGRQTAALKQVLEECASNQVKK